MSKFNPINLIGQRLISYTKQYIESVKCNTLVKENSPTKHDTLTLDKTLSNIVSQTSNPIIQPEPNLNCMTTRKVPQNTKILSNKIHIPLDPDEDKIIDLSMKMIGIQIRSVRQFKFNKSTILLNGCNINNVGNDLEDCFYSVYKKHIKSIERGQPQKSPDYWTNNRNFEYELKCYTDKPNFDISNFIGYFFSIVEFSIDILLLPSNILL